MFEDLDIAKKKIQDCISVISQKKRSIFVTASSEVFVTEIEKILKELKLFQNNINSTHSNFINEIIPTKIHYSEKYDNSYIHKLENIGINFKPIDEYNFILNERIDSLKIMRFDNEFESDIMYYRYLNECFIEINKLRLDFMRFYRGLKNKYKASNKIDDN